MIHELHHTRIQCQRSEAGESLWDVLINCMQQAALGAQSTAATLETGNHTCPHAQIMLLSLCVFIATPFAIHASEMSRMSAVTMPGSTLHPQALVKVEIGVRLFRVSVVLFVGSSMASLGEFSLPGDAGITIPDDRASALKVKPVFEPLPLPSTVEAVAEPVTLAPFPLTTVLTVVVTSPSGDETVRSIVTGVSARAWPICAPRAHTMAIHAPQLIFR